LYRVKSTSFGKGERMTGYAQIKITEEPYRRSLERKARPCKKRNVPEKDVRPSQSNILRLPIRANRLHCTDDKGE
jgi:hypothetical protein